MIRGVRVAGVSANLYGKPRQDLALFVFDEGVAMAGVFTLNAFCAAPVHVARDHLSQAPRAWLVNTKSANAGTGQLGMDDALRCCALAADQLGLDVTQVLPFSTGVIGARLPMDLIEPGIDAAVRGLGTDHWADAAAAILTTDTRPKQVTRTVTIDGETVSIEGISKGSGMIQPNMATMLGFVATDARVGEGDLQQLLVDATNLSFNRITVDGDTSTNDACVLAATGYGPELSPAHSEWSAFADAVTDVMVELAQAIVRDGEGATKFVTIDVSGAQSDSDAHAIAKTVAHSPLVKTALFASDANWGRLLAAIGRAPVDELDVSQIQLRVGDVSLLKDGAVDPSYTEADGARVFAQTDIPIYIELGQSDGRACVWTCDLSHDYVSINADYRS